jgi:hypothetical protein
MIDKERLEIIKFLRNSEKTVAPGMQPSELISRKDVDWLINRVEELELEVSDWRAEVQKWQKFYKESEESHSETKELLHSTISEIKRYKQALGFYADEETYEPLEVQIGAVTKEGYKISKYKYDPIINTDKGKKARETLGWEEGK